MTLLVDMIANIVQQAAIAKEADLGITKLAGG